MRHVSMWIHLGNDIIETTEQSWTTFNRINQGPFEFQDLSPDLQNLSETLQLLLSEAQSSDNSFLTATEAQAEDLRIALDVCESSCRSLHSIINSFAQLRPGHRIRFLDETSLGIEGRHELKIRIRNCSRTIWELSTGLYNISTTSNQPITVDVLGRVQTELIAEGAQIENLQPYHTQIKDYLRNLITSRPSTNITSLPQSNIPTLTYSLPSIFTPTITPGQTPYPTPSQILTISNQVPCLFNPSPIHPHPTETYNQILPTPEPSPRKDSMDPESCSYMSQISAALTNISFSIHIPTKPKVTRPHLARSSSAVFRGLADEERATGE